MAVINYNKSLVEFKTQGGWAYNPGVGRSQWTDTYRAIAEIRFFIHVWQRSACVQDVVDTLHEAHLTSDIDGRVKLAADKYNVLARAARWRTKGVPLKRLTQTPTRESLKQFALREAI